MEQSILFKNAYSPSDPIYSPSGCPERPIFEFDENGELVDTGKKTNTDALIDSYKDSVLLENIIKRCSMTGETFYAPEECFGDSRVLPTDLLDAKMKGSKVQSFVDSLSDADLSLLNEKGFDEFLLSKLKSVSTKTEPSSSKIEPSGGDNNE